MPNLNAGYEVKHIQLVDCRTVWIALVNGQTIIIEEPMRREPGGTVSVRIDQDEADAILSLLLHASETVGVSCEATDRLLSLFADAQRELSRMEMSAVPTNDEPL